MKKINLKFEGEELSREQLKEIVGGVMEVAECVYSYNSDCGGGEGKINCNASACTCQAFYDGYCLSYECCDNIDCGC
jgi:hypothetical protein